MGSRDGGSLKRFVALIAWVAMSVSGCASVSVDDLRFERLRIVSAGETLPRSVAKFAGNAGYPDGELIEATLSTQRDLIEVMQRDDGWMMSTRVRNCGAERPRGGVSSWVAVFYERKVVASLKGFYDDDPATPENSRSENGRYFYQVFFRTRDVLRPNWGRDAYDLAASPFDVCVDVGAAAFAGTIKFKSNVATIPASAFQALFAERVAGD